MIKHALIKELEFEGASTKKMLGRVPFDKFDWKPHEKSTSLGKLAVHVAEIPRWVTRVVTLPEYDFLTANVQPSEVHSTEDILKVHETNLQKAIADLQTIPDEELMTPWTFRRGEQVFFTLPRAAVIRNMAMNHMIHHRGQLSVYLRLLDVPVPGMYGPTADEKLF